MAIGSKLIVADPEDFTDGAIIKETFHRDIRPEEAWDRVRGR